jgi:hypothetical protein
MMIEPLELRGWKVCPRCEGQERHHLAAAMYDYGPLPWVWSHDMSSPECHEERGPCTFLIGCNRCHVAVAFEGEAPLEWHTWVDLHRHGRLVVRGRWARWRLRHNRDQRRLRRYHARGHR